MMGCVKIVSTFFLIAFSVAPALADADGQPRAATILEESYQLSRGLSIKDRAFFLVRLSDFSTAISPGRTEIFCEELLELAKKLPADWNRVATEKNGLVPLARVNPIRAFELLLKVEKPIPKEDGFTEDVRADAAVTIFRSYLKAVGVKGVPAIKHAAIAIGNTGEFPHRAIGKIIEQLLELGADSKLSIDLFNQALHFYSRGSLFQDEDAEFFELLQDAQIAISEDLYKKGLQEFILHLTTDKSLEPRGFKAEIQNEEGSFLFTSQKKFLLFRIMPRLVQFDRSRAEQLMQEKENSSLIHAGNNPKSIAAIGTSGILGNLAPQAQQQVNENLIQWRIKYVKDSDPIAALADAWHLPVGSPARTSALSSIIPSLIQFDQAKAREAYDEIQMSLDTLALGGSKLRGLVSIAKAAYYVNKPREFWDHTARAFDYGLQLVTADIEKTDKVTLQHPGSSDLLDLADFAAEHLGAAAVLPWIRSVQNDGLQAYLLLFAAKGLGKAEAGSRMVAQN